MKVRVLGEYRYDGAQKYVSPTAAQRMLRNGYECVGDFTIRKGHAEPAGRHKHRLPVAEANQTSVLDGKTWRHHNARCASYGEDVRTYGVVVA